MSSCFKTVFCCWKSSSNRLFYQTEDSEEQGIEYDRLIELPDCNTRSTGRLPAPQLILNERERHLISNKLYSEYADDQDRYNRMADEELSKDEERLAREEEEMYAQKTSQIREFYKNRPPSTSLGRTENFADFTTRFAEQSLQNENCVSDLVSNTVNTDPCVHVVTSVLDSITVPQLPDPVISLAPQLPNPVISSGQMTNPVISSGHVTDHVTFPSKEVLSVEQSDKLIQDIDDILQDKLSESTDMSEFYPEHYSDTDQDNLSYFSPGPTQNIDTVSTVNVNTVNVNSENQLVNTGVNSGNPGVNSGNYLLTEVMLDDSPHDNNFVEVSSTSNNLTQGQDYREGGEQESVFDPFAEFSKKVGDNSSEEDFVKID